MHLRSRRSDVPGLRCKHKWNKSMSKKGRSSHETAFTENAERGRKRALEQETRDLDMENEQKKKSKASYGVTTPQESASLRNGDLSQSLLWRNIYGIQDRKKYKADLKCQFGSVDIRTTNKMILRHCIGNTHHNNSNKITRQFQSKRDITPISVHNIHSFYESESSESESKEVGEIDIEMLTILGDDMMLRIFPLTLAGVAKRWLGRTPSEIIKTWDELKQVFIRRFCPPSVTFKKLGEIHNFKQEEGESLYQTWERFNDLLYKCTFHDLNDYQQVNTFYNGLGFYARQFLDSHGLISGLTAVKALESIQEVADDSLDLTP
ncbi:hypothetical protein Tco_0237061 [Tanacetum coccineum]